MRAVEMSTKKAAAVTAEAAAQPKVELSYEEKKRLTRAVQNAERRIEKLEQEITKIELDMADPSFYQSPDAEKTMEKYKGKKQDLETAYSEWEEAQEVLDNSLGG